MHRVERREIDLLGHFFAGFDLERRLRDRFHRADGLALSARDFEAKPALARGILELDVPSGQIRDANRGHDRLVGDVLQPREFQFHLNLRARFHGTEE